jgi:hypothetical protein
MKPLALDQHQRAGDQHDAVLPLFAFEVGGGAYGSLAAGAVAEAVAALQLAELVAATGDAADLDGATPSRRSSGR